MKWSIYYLVNTVRLEAFLDELNPMHKIWKNNKCKCIHIGKIASVNTHYTGIFGRGVLDNS